MLRVWRKRGLQPHRVERFKFSTDPAFATKMTDVVGLYLHPPEKALVLCIDEKSQIQALNRTQPLLPLRPGIPARMTHDYERNGTTTLFAALEVATGKVHGRCFDRHSHEEFITFLNSVARRYSRREVHVICDNYGTHKHPKVKEWLAAHPRFHMHFTPTSSSWLNLVERLVRPDHQPGHPPRQLRQRRRAGTSHQRVPRQLERRPQALRLDQDPGADPVEDSSC